MNKVVPNITTILLSEMVESDLEYGVVDEVELGSSYGGEVESRSIYSSRDEENTFGSQSEGASSSASESEYNSTALSLEEGVSQVHNRYRHHRHR